MRSKAFSRIIFSLIFRAVQSSNCGQKELKLNCFLSFQILIQISHKPWVILIQLWTTRPWVQTFHSTLLVEFSINIACYEKKATIPRFTRIRKNKGLQKSLKQWIHAPSNVKPAGEGGGGGRVWGGDLLVFVGPGVGHLTNLVLPGEGIFESFFARRGDI